MEDLTVGRWTIPASEIEEVFDTSGGPGGQHANRTRSAVRLRFDVMASSLPEEAKSKLSTRVGSSIEASSSDSRSQFRNRAIARRRLATKIAEAVADPAQRRQTRPTRSSRDKRLASKRARGELKRQRRRPDVE